GKSLMMKDQFHPSGLECSLSIVGTLSGPVLARSPRGRAQAPSKRGWNIVHFLFLRKLFFETAGGQSGHAAATSCGSTSPAGPRRLWAMRSRGVGAGLTWTTSAPARLAITGSSAAG